MRNKHIWAKVWTSWEIHTLAQICKFKKLKVYETKYLHHNCCLFYESKLDATRKSYKKYKKVLNSRLPNSLKTSPNLRFCSKKKKIPTAGLYYKDFGSWSSSPLFFKEVMAPRKWAPKRRFSVVHVGRWLHETLWKWWWSPWGWPLFSLRDRPHQHCVVCIGGNEGICWLIILNSVYLDIYCPEKVT